MGLFNILVGLLNGNDDDNQKDKRLEQEMEWNYFDDYEKDEVRKGNYDIYNFEDSEDEDLDEDDYYSDNWK